MTIRGKLGTHPTAIYTVKGQRSSNIEEGDIITIVSTQDTRVLKPTEVFVNQIYDECYYMSMR